MPDNEFMGNWDGIYASQTWAEYPTEDLIRFTAKNFYHVKDRAAIKILEIGCGPGPNLRFLAQEKFAVYGVDKSAVGISLARKKLDAQTPGWVGDLRVGDISVLPFEPDFFDAVIDNAAVYCNSFEKSRAIYAEASRVLKPNGLLYVRTFATGCWGDETGESAGYHAWIPTEGPFVGTGFARFTAQADIQDLLPNFKIDRLELLRRTTNNLEHELREWSICAIKSLE